MYYYKLRPRSLSRIRVKNIVYNGKEVIKMDKKAIAKTLMSVLGIGLTLAANFVNTRNQDDKMKEEIDKRVDEALAARFEES